MASRMATLWSSRRPKTLMLGLALLLIAGSCGGGSGGGDGAVVAQVVVFTVAEEEYNGDLPHATVLPLDRAGIGTLETLGDIDYWQFNATAGQVISVDICAARFDYEGWTLAGNLPRVTLLGPPNGTFGEIQQSLNNNGFFYLDTPIDMDISCYRIQVDGTYYVCLQTDFAGTGARYAVKVTVQDLGVLQLEQDIPGPGLGEPVGFGGFNDTFFSALPIVPGTIHGDFNGDLDFYSFEILEPTIVKFDVKAFRNGVTPSGLTWVGGEDWIDTQLTLFDSVFAPIYGNDDFTFYDPALEYKIVTPGTYYVALTSGVSVYAGVGPYFLTYSTSIANPIHDAEPNNVAGNAIPIPYGTTVSGMVGPADDDWYQFAAQEGDMIRLTPFTGLFSNNQGATATVAVNLIQPDTVTPVNADFGPTEPISRAIIQATGTHYVQVQNLAGSTPYCFRLELIKKGFPEIESNDVSFNATNLGFSPTNTGAGKLEVVGDTDWWSFAAEINQLVGISVYATTLGASEGSFSIDGHGSTLWPSVDVPAQGQAIPNTLLGFAPFPRGMNDSLPTMTVYFVAPVTQDGYRVHITDPLLSPGLSQYYLVEKR